MLTDYKVLKCTVSHLLGGAPTLQLFDTRNLIRCFILLFIDDNLGSENFKFAYIIYYLFLLTNINIT